MSTQYVNQSALPSWSFPNCQKANGVSKEGVDGVYRESWFTQFRLLSVVKTLKIYGEAWGEKILFIVSEHFPKIYR
jgi:hypothetical protein